MKKSRYQRRTDCIDIGEAEFGHGDGHGAQAWSSRANDLSLAASVYRYEVSDVRELRRLREENARLKSWWQNAIWKLK